MVSFVILLLACTARIVWRTDRQTERQNDKPSTVTLAAHARRGLIIQQQNEYGNHAVAVMTDRYAIVELASRLHVYGIFLI